MANWIHQLYVRYRVWRGQAINVWSKSPHPAHVLSNLHPNALKEVEPREEREEPTPLKPQNPAPPERPVPPIPSVIQQPWGYCEKYHEEAAQLMLEIRPEAFEGGQVVVAIEMGYLDTKDFAPPQWVEHNCSGLVYDGYEDVPEKGLRLIFMHTDPMAVKPGSPYKYLISGTGGGEYEVEVLAVHGEHRETVFQRCFDCK